MPFRATVEMIGVDVDWDPDSQTVLAQSSDVAVRLPVGSLTAFRNDNPVTLDVPAVIEGGRTLVPLRFFSEAFGAVVAWDEATRTVSLVSPPLSMRVVGFYALGDRSTSSWVNLFGLEYPETTAGNTDMVSDLALGWYTLDGDGNLHTQSSSGWQRPAGWERVVAESKTYGLRTQMTVHATDSDGRLTQLLGNGPSRQQAVAAIVEEARLYDGVNLDLEGLGLSQTGDDLQRVRDSFTTFARELSHRLKGSGKTLTLTLHAPNSSYRGYDYAELGTFADNIIIMAYDYGPRPEPTAAVIAAVEQALDLVPPERLMLGISLPSENAESFGTKVAIAKRYRLGGIALWRLGLVSDEAWAAMRTMIRVP